MGVHPFFSVLESTLSLARVPADQRTGTIRFEMLGPAPECWLVELRRDRCSLRACGPEEAAELLVFCGGPQLDAMLANAESLRALRFEGDETLFESLVATMRVARNTIEIRSDE